MKSAYSTTFVAFTWTREGDSWWAFGNCLVPTEFQTVDPDSKLWYFEKSIHYTSVGRAILFCFLFSRKLGIRHFRPQSDRTYVHGNVARISSLTKREISRKHFRVHSYRLDSCTNHPFYLINTFEWICVSIFSKIREQCSYGEMIR